MRGAGAERNDDGFYRLAWLLLLDTILFWERASLSPTTRACGGVSGGATAIVGLCGRGVVV
jgi:hypothetical protein